MKYYCEKVFINYEKDQINTFLFVKKDVYLLRYRGKRRSKKTPSYDLLLNNLKE